MTKFSEFKKRALQDPEVRAEYDALEEEFALDRERITDDLVECWRINYGLDKRSPEEAHRWWAERCNGMAPAGVVAALGLALLELDVLRAELALRIE